MHEASLVQSVLDTAFAQMQAQAASRVCRVRLRVGALAGVAPDALAFAFDALKQDTPAAEATLEVEFLPLRLHCPACDGEFAADDYPDACPMCGGWQTEARQGRELEIVGLELSRED